MFTREEHWKYFSEFCRNEIAIGGPDPHMNLAAKIVDNMDSSFKEKAWMGLCYAAVYNVPTAFALFVQPLPGTDTQEKWEIFLKSNWHGIAFRRERKAVRSVEKLARCLVSANDWLESKCKENDYGPVFGWVTFEQAFEDVCSIYGFGRYIGQKYVEYARRHLGATVQVEDIRPVDGWSPRAGLALLFPDYEKEINGGDSDGEINIVNDCAGILKHKLKSDYGVDLDYYLLQVLLCDYKQSVIGERQFPGRSQDREIEYDAKIAPVWGRCEAMFTARKQIFPAKALGEINCWDRVRKELGTVLANYKYTWSDLEYSYHHSKHDLANPVRWTDVKGEPKKPVTFSQDSLFGLDGVEAISVKLKKSPKLHAIIPSKLYQRGEFECTDAHLAENGIKLVVGLAGKRDMSLKIPYIWNPIPDGKKLDPDAIIKLARTVIEEHNRLGGAILVHCHAGRNRSGLLSALLVMAFKGVTGKAAVDVVRNGRPRALANLAFVNFLSDIVKFDGKNVVMSEQ